MVQAYLVAVHKNQVHIKEIDHLCIRKEFEDT